MRGNDNKRSASDKSTVSNDIVDNNDAVFGLGASFFLRFFLAPSSTISSGNTSVIYAPNLPDFAITSNPVSGSVPSFRSPEGFAKSSIAFGSVNSSGAISSGMLANFRSSPCPCCR